MVNPRLIRIRTYAKRGSLLLLLLLIITHGTATFILGRRVDARIQAYQAQGDPVSMADLTGSDIDDSENGGIIYDEIQADLQAYRDKTSKEWDALMKKLPMQSMQRDYPNLALDHISGEDVRSRRIESERGFTEQPQMLPMQKELTAKAVELYLRPARSMLPKIEIAASKPRSRFEANWQDGPIGITFPYLAGMREVARTLGAEATVEARDGRMDQAMQTLSAAFKASEALREEPTVISMLVRVATLSMNSKALLTVAHEGKIDKAQARRLYDILSGMRMRHQSVLAAKTERTIGISIFKTVAERGGSFLAVTEPGPAVQSLHTVFRDRISGSYIWRPFLYADELLYLDDADRMVRDWHHLYREINYQKPDEMEASALDQLPFYSVFTRMLSMRLTKALCRRDSATAMVSGNRIFLGLLEYRDSYGRYPATLDELRSKLGWKIDEDPFTGRDFIYKQQGNAFVLYSIGENFKDDSGRGFQTGDRQKGAQRDDDDITWRMDR